MYEGWENVLEAFTRFGLPARRAATVTAGGTVDRLREDRVRKRLGLVAGVEVERDGERFVLSPARRTLPRVLDGDRRRRHLLLLLRRGASERRLLFGHDERHLFWSILPGAERAESLEEAFAALAPRGLGGAAIGPETGIEGRTIRQGEWFFTPAPRFVPDHWMLLRSGVLRRAGRVARGKPHVADEAAAFVDEGGKLQQYVRGAVRHVDHATVHLDCWHRVQLNREEGKGSGPRGGARRFDED